MNMCTKMVASVVTCNNGTERKNRMMERADEDVRETC